MSVPPARYLTINVCGSSDVSFSTRYTSATAPEVAPCRYLPLNESMYETTSLSPELFGLVFSTFTYA